MFKRLGKILFGLVLGGVLLQGAQASVLFVGSGTWDANATTSTFSAPGATWSFVFQLPDVIGSNPTAAPSAFSYSLNGIKVSTPATSIEFFTSADSGMFDIDFQNAQAVSFYGPIVLKSQSLTSGTYDVFAGLNGGLPLGSGIITLQPVPEPETWAMLALGLAALGFVSRRKIGAARA